MAGKDPIDPNVGPRFVLAGDVVTMDDHLTVVPDGRIYVDSGVITAVLPAAAPAPAGFEKVKTLQSKGTIYPGLIELHNHLSYDVLPLWQVPKRYSNRDQWQGPATQGLISGPMKVIGSHPGYPEAVVRYVECKCLLGGVTTSQGVALFSFSGISTYYRGIVRNVERTDDPELPAWKSHIADVAAKDASIFVDSIKHSRYLLHLSEGTDASARAHFEALHLSGNTWAINQNLAGIHCVALTDADFAALASRGGSMVWSPLSNLLLYGATADVAAAKEGGRAHLARLRLVSERQQEPVRRAEGGAPGCAGQRRAQRQRPHPVRHHERRSRRSAGTRRSARSRPESAPISSSSRATAATRTRACSTPTRATSSSSRSTAPRATATPR